MKVLVTGGSGRVGRAVCDFLADQEKTGLSCLVINLDRQRPEKRSGWFIEADTESLEVLYDVMARHKPDAVVHLAANPLPHGVARHKQFMGNLGSLHSVTQAAMDLGINRLVVASSERAAGWSSEGLMPPIFPYDETVMTPTSNPYSLAKRLGEDLVGCLCMAAPEMRAVSLRINYVINGPVPEPPRHEAPRWHDRHAAHMWGYVRAEDVASAVWASILQAQLGHRIYSIAARNSLSTIPTRDLLAAKFGEVCPVADWLPEFGAVVDTRRAERDLGWVAKVDWRDPHPSGS